jgi:hypothetical protein
MKCIISLKEKWKKNYQFLIEKLRKRKVFDAISIRRALVRQLIVWRKRKFSVEVSVLFVTPSIEK